jgi:dinuclear metal center YbgI/SA1388 family protein
MKVRTIYEILNEISPFELQEEWDNSGLNLGDFGNEFEKIYVSLDVDDRVIAQLKPNSLLITHHPLIFRGIKRVIPNSFSTKYLIELIKKDINLIAMHTNFDKTHLNNYFATQVLGLDGESEDFVFYSDVFMEFDELVTLVKEKLEVGILRVTKTQDFIKRVAITTGSGMGLLNTIKADCFLTGDIKYHEAMDAKARDISLIDIGHYESERYFVDIMKKALESSGIEKEIISIDSDNPFMFI